MPESFHMHDAAAATRTSLLIEGWRDLCHSYALVNQYQILELLRRTDVALSFNELPLFNPDWARGNGVAGFSAEEQFLINALPAPDGGAVDCVYRISSPVVPGRDDDVRRTLTFMITELGFTPDNIAAGPERYGFFTREGNSIVTPSNWSRDLLVDFGFPAEKVHLVPLGVDTNIFAPLPGPSRASSRAALGIADDETLFVNVGGAFWNKGIDLILRAFAILHAQGRKVRLILKDMRDVYGVTVEQRLAELAQGMPYLASEELRAAISVVSTPLSRAQLRSLYSIADAYLSPYRAEGFNMPVLEALACGTPVIVTAGGATDDFCPPGVGWHLPGTACVLDSATAPLPNRYIEPDFDALVNAMDEVARGLRPNPVGFAQARAGVLERFSWASAANALVALARGAALPPAPPVIASAWMGQRDILALLGLMHPYEMAGQEKVRIGGTYDGGYVLPACAWDADAVLSIGVGHDVSFDFALAQRGARILQFDHTVEASPQTHENFQFHKLGLGVQSGGAFLSFAEMCGMIDALGAKRPLLKFDIEGAEYEIFGGIDPDMLQRFEVMTCEIHDLERLGEPAFYAKVLRFMQVMTRHHAPMHLHPNNYAGVQLVQGVPLPPVLELSFLRRDLDALPRLATAPIPGPLDAPNHPLIPDIHLGLFCTPTTPRV